MTSIDYRQLLRFYNGKKVFLTGHTGFKGAWLSHLLLSAGAKVTGYSLCPSTEPSLFSLLDIEHRKNMVSLVGDVRNLGYLKESMAKAAPDIVFHLAAQPIVRDSYRDPVGTYKTNVMGTVHICECVRLSHLSVSNGGMLPDEPKSSDWMGVRSFLNITTDKVYKNREWEWGYRETDNLDGFDPYSNSKSCSELVTHGYKNSFFHNSTGVRVSTARAGNVIGGGDFANDRIIPDCIRALIRADALLQISTLTNIEERKNALQKSSKAVIEVRNPHSIRPYEHVLEPIFAYLLIAKAQYKDEKYSGYYNIGPDDVDCITTGDLVDLFCTKWNKHNSAPVDRSIPSGIKDKEGNKECVGNRTLPKIRWTDVSNLNDDNFHEANFLKLDCSKLKTIFSWKPTWHIDKAVEQVVAFTAVLLNTKGLSKNVRAEMLRAEIDREIDEFCLSNHNFS